MSNMKRCLERQEKEIKERRPRNDEQVVMAMGTVDISSHGRHCGSQVNRGSNVDRHRHSRGKNLLEDYFIQNYVYYNVDFRGRYRMQPHLFNKVMHDVCNYDAYFIQKCDAAGVLGLLPEQKLTAVK
ncbi:unnamed protein product [Prunus brigantina]